MYTHFSLYTNSSCIFPLKQMVLFTRLIPIILLLYIYIRVSYSETQIGVIYISNEIESCNLSLSLVKDYYLFFNTSQHFRLFYKLW